MNDIAQALDKLMVEAESREDRIRAEACQRNLERGETGVEPLTEWSEAERVIEKVDAAR